MKHLMNKTSKKTWAWILAVVMTLSIIIPTSLLTAKAEVTAPTFSEAAGWFESAYAEWTSKGATQYKAYVKEAGAADSTYVQIDDELIRNYGDYWRVDAVGLKAGSYQIKVVASDGSKEANKVTDVLTVSAYDRTGFAWVDGTASGAYNEDGTLKSNAVVLYLTEDTKDTMTLDVVTSSKGATTACTGIVDILAAYKKGYDARPLDIRVIGKVTNEGKISSDDDSKGDIVISGSGSSKRLSCGVTIEGIGEDATAYGWGLRIKNSSNVEVRNIGFMMCDSAEGDNVGLQQDNDHVWVHNCDMFYGQAGGDKDQAKGDGALDSKLSTYVTFSYNHFWDSGKCNLLGLKEGTTKGYYITYHHNWYDHSDSRHPRCRYYSAHVYNNYYDGNSKYGIGSTLGSSVFAEGNYFRNCQYPILTSMQGSDVFAGGTSRDVANNATFSKEAGGTIKAFNNIMTGKYTFIPYGSSTYTLKGTQTAFNLDGTSSTADFDAVVVSSASEKVDSSVKSYLGSNTYNNFDTSSSMYSYTADAPEDVPSIVTATAGRMNGGDFSWTFNNEVDDESYAVNAELKAALVSYESSVKSIGGSVNKSEDTTKDSTADTTSATTKADETTSATSTTKAEETTTAGQSGTAGVYVQNFTTDGTSSSFFTISGNLSKDKGTVTYNGLTLTQCLKLESKTNIEFTAPSEGTLTLVFNSDSKNVKIDGNKIAATNGIVTSKLAAGKHTVIKGDSAYLYYMTFATEGSTTETTTAKETEATTKETETTTKETETTAKETEAPTQAPGADDNGKYDSTSADYSGAYTNISTKKDSDFANAKYVSSSEEILDAIASAKAGDVIIVKEGTYSFTSDGAAAIVIDNAKNGSENAYIILKAEEGKNVKFDFSAQSLNSANRGLVVDGDYWYFEGINFYGAGDNGVLLAGNNNIFEKCTFEANRDSGLQISRYDTNAASIDLWPSNNLIINCTAFDNCDFPDQGGTGENADGFAAKLTCGEGNVFDGCISYCNSDDGWDLFAKPATGPIGKITLRNCVAFGNGSLTNGIHYPNGDMNGFKLGGKGVGTPHSIFNCLAFNNGACGFTDNNNPSALTVLNCTAIDNAKEDSEKCNFNFYRANAGLYMNLIASKGAAKSDSFKGAVLNTTYRNGEDFYHVTTKTTFAGKKEKLGEKVSDPSSVGAFKNTNNTIDVTKNIDSLLRNADGTINMNGLYETTGEYSSMGARYNVKSQVITVALSATSGGNGEEATTEAPTSAPTQAPTDAPTSVPTQAPTSAPTQAPTSAPTQAPTSAPTQAPTSAPTQAPTQAPTEPVKSETLVLKSNDVSTGTYTDSFVTKGFIITAQSDSSVVVDGNKKTLGSDSFTNRIKTGGEGTTAYRSVAFKTNGASTITIAAMSSSGSATRTIQILDKDGNVVSSVDGVGGKTLSAYTLTVPSAGVYYIGSKSSGLNIYKLTVTNAIALTSVSDLGEAPTEAPTTAPTQAPTVAPTTAPTQAPTVAPTTAPTTAPTQAPTVAPTTAPTQAQTTVSSTEGTTKAGEVGADVDNVTSESKTNITASSEETVSSTEAASTAKAGQVAADSSKTGDSSMAWLYAVIALIACGAIGGTYVVSKKHRA